MADRINQAPFDRYTFAHMGFGATFAGIGTPWWGTLAISIAFEMVEDRLKDTYPQAFPFSSHDSRRNTVGDTVALMAAYFYTQYHLKQGLSPAGQLALRTAMTSTLTAFTAAVGAGALASIREDVVGKQAASAGYWGYAVGSTAGGASAARRGPPVAPIAAGAGAVVAGPVGAATGAYLAAR